LQSHQSYSCQEAFSRFETIIVAITPELLVVLEALKKKKDGSFFQVMDGCFFVLEFAENWIQRSVIEDFA
jgi:hypothetical protein